MLHEKVWLTSLQVHCPSRDLEINKVAGQLRNLFYAASFPWHHGNLGRIIPRNTFTKFYEEYQELKDRFYKLANNELEFVVVLTFIPFPKLDSEKKSRQLFSDELENRFERRIRMLRDSLQDEKRFYQSLLTELNAVVDTGLYLEKEIDKKLLKRIERANSDILCYSAEAIRRSTSLKEDIITICGALL